MTFLTSWEEFSKAAERLYVNDPSKVGFFSMIGIDILPFSTFTFDTSERLSDTIFMDIRDFKKIHHMLKISL